MINDKQLKLLNRLFKKTGRPFQTLAKEAGLKNVPDHVYEITKDQAQQIIDTHKGWLHRG